jgi:hypothetical protein
MDEVLQAADRDRASAGLGSPRLQFFLKHQIQIRTWQGLAREAWEEVEHALHGLGAELSDLGVGEAGFEIGRAITGRTRVGLVLFRPEWLYESDTRPPVGIAVGWDSHPNPGRSWPNSGLPYYGVLTAKSETGRSIRAALGPIIEAHLARGGPQVAGFVIGSDWSVYKRVDKAPDWWRDFLGWRQAVAREFLDAARTWAPAVDEALLRAGPAG